MNWPVKHDERADQKLAKAQRDLRLLQPKIVYRAAREKKSQEFQQFAAMMVDAIDLLLADDKKVESRFEHFVNFFEALMAYHKAAGEGVYIGKEG